MPKNKACAECGDFIKNTYVRIGEKYRKLLEKYCVYCDKKVLMTKALPPKREYQAISDYFKA